jgi:hypothetical protein
MKLFRITEANSVNTLGERLLIISPKVFSTTEPQTRRSRHLLQIRNDLQEFGEIKASLRFPQTNRI